MFLTDRWRRCQRRGQTMHTAYPNIYLIKKRNIQIVNLHYHPWHPHHHCHQFGFIQKKETHKQVEKWWPIDSKDWITIWRNTPRSPPHHHHQQQQTNKTTTTIIMFHIIEWGKKKKNKTIVVVAVKQNKSLSLFAIFSLMYRSLGRCRRHQVNSGKHT